eukprot:jgi/Ulvmu1/9992/UM059_0041.1
MGRSRRRMKKDAPKVRVGVVKRSKKLKAPVPKDIAAGCPALAAKLQKDCTWETCTTPTTNYQQNGLINEVNRIKAPETDAASPESDDDAAATSDQDLQRVLSMQHPSGPRAPDPLTANQRRVVAALVAAHGDNLQAMARDRKLNKMLLPASKLKRMIASAQIYKAGDRVRFQQPKRGLT